MVILSTVSTSQRIPTLNNNKKPGEVKAKTFQDNSARPAVSG